MQTPMFCQECREPIREDQSICPHCGRPSLFPNVNIAERDTEQQALQSRYEAAQREILTNLTVAVATAFEQAVAGSEAVLCKYFGEATRLCYSDDEVYATFYQRVQSGIRIPGGDKWDRLRAIADTILFGEANKIQVRFGALTMDGFGLENYGDCSMVLKTEMIAHRATVFEENSVIFMQKNNIRGENGYAIPDGHRAKWASRQLLAISKLASQITTATKQNEFPALLLKSGADSGSDNFIEVHIWGPVTIRSFRKIAVRQWVTAPSAVDLNVFEEKLAQFGITFQKP